jgi:DegV family protein with EDD domain
MTQERQMPPVAIVTDSTSNIPESLLRNLPITILPLQICWKEKIFLDGIDIQPDEFYKRLVTDKVLPTTSQATPAMFQQAYSRLTDEGNDILSIHISSKLSGTMDSAFQARNSLPGARIELFDSESTAMAMGWQVLAAARAAAQGATLLECKTLVEKARAQSGVLFLLDTLEFLHKGGRIGGASAFFGMAFNIKPILELRDGTIQPADKVRTSTKAQDKLLDIMEKRINGRFPVHLSALNANAYPEAEALLERARKRFSATEVTETNISVVSPVLGVHTGPGALGIAYLAGM